MTRLLALVERSKAARTSNGRELVVIKDAAIKAFMKDKAFACALAADTRLRMLMRRRKPQAGPQAIVRRSVGP